MRLVQKREDIYGASEAARILNVTPGRIRQLLESGELEGTKDGGRWRIPQRAVHARLEEFPRRVREAAPDTPDSVREWVDRALALEREIGGLKALEKTTRSTLEAQIREERERLLKERGEERDRLLAERKEERDRLLRERDGERQRADDLRDELERVRGRGFWSRLFGGGG